MTGIEIRLATPRDAYGIALAYAVAIVECYGPIDPITCFRDIIELKKQEDLWHKKICDPACFTFVAEQDGQVIGMAHNTPPFAPVTDPALDKPFDVGQVYLHKNARGHGIGQRLVVTSLREGFTRGHRSATVHGTAARAAVPQRSLHFFEDICYATRSHTRPFFVYTWNGAPLVAVQSEWRNITADIQQELPSLHLPAFEIPDRESSEKEMLAVLRQAAATLFANRTLSEALNIDAQGMFDAFMKRDPTLFSLRLKMKDPSGIKTYADLDTLPELPHDPLFWVIN